MFRMALIINSCEKILKVLSRLQDNCSLEWLEIWCKDWLIVAMPFCSDVQLRDF